MYRVGDNASELEAWLVAAHLSVREAEFGGRWVGRGGVQPDRMELIRLDRIEHQVRLPTPPTTLDVRPAMMLGRPADSKAAFTALTRSDGLESLDVETCLTVTVIGCAWSIVNVKVASPLNWPVVGRAAEPSIS